MTTTPRADSWAPVPSAALGPCGLGVVLALSRISRGPGLLVVWLGVLRLGAVWLGARGLEAPTVGLDPVLATGRAGQRLERGRVQLLTVLGALTVQVGTAETLQIRAGGRGGAGGARFGDGRSGRWRRLASAAAVGGCVLDAGCGTVVAGSAPPTVTMMLRVALRTGSGRWPVAATATPPVARATATAASPTRRAAGRPDGASRAPSVGRW